MLDEWVSGSFHFRFIPEEGRGRICLCVERRLGLAQGTFLSRTIKRLVGVMFTLGAGSLVLLLRDSRFIYEMSL